MTSKEIYQSIDQSKISPKGKSFLQKAEKSTNGFTIQNDKLDSVMKKLYSDLKSKKPEALKNVTTKTVEKEVKVPTTKSEQKKDPKKTTKTVKKKVKKASGTKKVTKPTKTPSTPKKDNVEHISTRASKLAKKEGISFKEARAKLSKEAKEQIKKEEKQADKELDKLLKFVRKDVFEDGEKYPKIYGKQDPEKASLSADAKRMAKPVGKRVSKNGKTYYEYRDNRSDRNSLPAPKGQYKYKGKTPPFLADGGAIDSLKKDMNSKLDIHSEYYAKGGEVDYRGYVTNDVVEDMIKANGLNVQIEENWLNGYEIFGQKTELDKVKSLLNEYNIKSEFVQTQGFGLNKLKVPSQVIQYAKGGEVNEAYIDYMNKDKGYKTDRKYFKTYEDAEKWARNEFDSFYPDMISYTEYERPLRSFAKGGRTISIVNDGVKYDKSKYKAVYGDFDKDGTVNIDDANPLDKTKSGQVEQVELRKTFDKLLGVKAELDEIMYDAVETLDEKAPKGADIYARTKTPYSILKKLVEKRMLDPKRGLTDMIGTTIAVDNQKELEQVRDKIDGGLLGKVLDRDDFYKSPNAGYMAYHYIVEYKGVPVEVQLKTKNMKKLHEVSHEAYKNGTLNAKSLDSLSKTFMKADKGDAKAKSEISRLLKDKKLLASKISKGSMEAGGTLPTPFGQAGLVGETGAMNEMDMFAMGGGLPQGVHQYYANTYNPAYPTPHGYAKGGALKGSNRSTGESYGVVVGSKEVMEDGDVFINVRTGYNSRISESKLKFNNGNIEEITDYGYTLDGSMPDLSAGSGKSYYATTKAETIKVLSKLYNPSFAKKLIEYSKEKFADGGKTQGYNDRLDESLGNRDGVEPMMMQSYKDRRDESKGMEKSMGRRAYQSVGSMDKMAKGGKVNLNKLSDETYRMGEIDKKHSKRLFEISDDLADLDLGNKTYAKGGRLSTSDRYVLELAGLTGLRKNAIEELVKDNSLTESELLNIIVGVGRQQIKSSVVVSAVMDGVNSKANTDLVKFAKSEKAMRLAKGGEIDAFIMKFVKDAPASNLRVDAEELTAKLKKGGKLGFDGLAKKVAKRYVGKPVKGKFQSEYGKTYSKAEAMEVGKKVAGKVYRQQQAMEKGGKVSNKDFYKVKDTPTYKYRVTDNVFYNAFETNSQYDAMANLTQRLEGSKIIATIKNKYDKTEKSFRWDLKENSIAKMEAGGTLPTPFGQAGLVGETGTMNEMDMFAMGGGLPQGVHQYYANTYNPAYPTPHGYAKGGKVDFSNRTSDDFKLGELVYDTKNKTYGTIIGIYNKYNSDAFEVRLDSDGMQYTSGLRKLGEKGDNGTKKQLFEAVSSYEGLIKDYPQNKYPKMINNPFYAKGGEIVVKGVDKDGGEFYREFDSYEDALEEISQPQFNHLDRDSIRYYDEDDKLVMAKGGKIKFDDSSMMKKLWNERGFDIPYLESLSDSELKGLYDSEFDDERTYNFKTNRDEISNDYAKGGRTQGYNDKLDESLGNTKGKRSTKEQNYKDRRNESEAMENKGGKRKYSRVNTMDKMAKGGRLGTQILKSKKFKTKEEAEKGMNNLKNLSMYDKDGKKIILRGIRIEKEQDGYIATASYLKRDYRLAKGGKTQGYNDKLDESLGNTKGKRSTKEQNYKDRRNESEAMEKKGGKRKYARVKTMDKGNRSKRKTPMSLAKEIRKEGEKWQDAVKRASAMLKKV